jgi:hypothetical protein
VCCKVGSANQEILEQKAEPATVQERDGDLALGWEEGMGVSRMEKGTATLETWLCWLGEEGRSEDGEGTLLYTDSAFH